MRTHRTEADLREERARIRVHLDAAERRLATHRATDPPTDGAAFKMWCRRTDHLAAQCDRLEHALTVIGYRIDRAHRREQKALA